MKDAGWRQRIVRALAIREGETWIEIGAGHGEMTRELARRAGRVVAIELDPPLVESLRRLAAEHANIEVVGGDVLQLDLTALAGSRRARVYGSLPYYITSPILRRLFESAGGLDSLAVVIQLEVAARIVALPRARDFGFLSVLAQFYARPEIALRLPPGAFQPRPKVASALVKMSLPGARASLGVGDGRAFLEFAGRCFAHKRKTLVNNLREAYTVPRVEEALRASGLEGRARAEELSLPELADVFGRLRGQA